MNFNSESLTMLLFFFGGIAVGVVWYFGYIQPADEARYAILECMDSDRSFQAYENCRR